ncbi:hypothetical protein PFAG_04813 [Plasmodium falciparum Santa Lucia]|nr:hypothetical protein PFAG_04813 [Plasmodium falciparum Santa Lucia]
MKCITYYIYISKIIPFFWTLILRIYFLIMYIPFIQLKNNIYKFFLKKYNEHDILSTYFVHIQKLCCYKNTFNYE